MKPPAPCDLRPVTQQCKVRKNLVLAVQVHKEAMMSDQQPKKRRGRAAPPKTDAIPAPSDFRRANEKMLQNIGKLLQEREFGSADEANAYLQELLSSGGIPALASTNPLDRAQELMYDAWEATGSRRIKLARQALEIS